MKKILFIALMAFSMNAFAQQRYDLDKQKQESKITYTKTADVAVYKGVEYPVYLSANKKQFIFVVSRNGKTYKKYINTEPKAVASK